MEQIRRKYMSPPLRPNPHTSNNYRSYRTFVEQKRLWYHVPTGRWQCKVRTRYPVPKEMGGSARKNDPAGARGNLTRFCSLSGLLAAHCSRYSIQNWKWRTNSKSVPTYSMKFKPILISWALTSKSNAGTPALEVQNVMSLVRVCSLLQVSYIAQLTPGGHSGRFRGAKSGFP
jgi:hypothetical protein